MFVDDTFNYRAGHNERRLCDKVGSRVKWVNSQLVSKEKKLKTGKEGEKEIDRNEEQERGKQEKSFIHHHLSFAVPMSSL